MMKCTVRKMLNGLQWIYENNKGEKLSVICHDGSYGHEEGFFEIMPWTTPRHWHDSVKGYLTFGDVQRWINKLERSEKKK